jgi:hypothetical protein
MKIAVLVVAAAVGAQWGAFPAVMAVLAAAITMELIAKRSER